MNSNWQQEWLKLQKHYTEALAIAGKSVLSSHYNIPGTSTDWSINVDKPLVHTWEMLSSQFAELLTVLNGNNREDFDWESALRGYVKTAKERIKVDMTRIKPGVLQVEILSSFEKLFESMSSGPGFSTDKRLQEIYRYWTHYQQNCQRYRHYLKNVDLASLDIVQEKLILIAEGEDNISSLREFYDLWVDCYEEAYETIILSDEYSEIYGEMVNSLLEYRVRSQDFSL
ncbi:MAG: hypothetical protein GKR93_10480 [Gammaproteobacteria bacterium]|nr:hypothetical protein [Gammaproteobacteria bacterium]